MTIFIISQLLPRLEGGIADKVSKFGLFLIAKMEQTTHQEVTAIRYLSLILQIIYHIEMRTLVIS